MFFGGFWKILEEIKFICNTIRSSQLRHETDLSDALRRIEDLEGSVSDLDTKLDTWANMDEERYRTDDHIKSLIKQAMDEYKTLMEKPKKVDKKK